MNLCPFEVNFQPEWSWMMSQQPNIITPVKECLSIADLITTEIPILFEKLQSSKNGLTQIEAEIRKQSLGFNIIQFQKSLSKRKQFILHFLDYFTLFLLSCAILLFVFDSPQWGWKILLLAGINLVFNYSNIIIRQRSYHKMTQWAFDRIKIIREGQSMLVPSNHLVIGDILLLEENDRIYADARLFECDNLEISEFLLSGINTPMHKTAGEIKNWATGSLVTNCVYFGSKVIQGSGKALVYATGMHTHFGQLLRHDFPKLYK